MIIETTVVGWFAASAAWEFFVWSQRPDNIFPEARARRLTDGIKARERRVLRTIQHPGGVGGEGWDEDIYEFREGDS